MDMPAQPRQGNEQPGSGSKKHQQENCCTDDICIQFEMHPRACAALQLCPASSASLLPSSFSVPWPFGCHLSVCPSVGSFVLPFFLSACLSVCVSFSPSSFRIVFLLSFCVACLLAYSLVCVWLICCNNVCSFVRLSVDSLVCSVLLVLPHFSTLFFLPFHPSFFLAFFPCNRSFLSFGSAFMSGYCSSFLLLCSFHRVCWLHQFCLFVLLGFSASLLSSSFVAL